MQDRVNYYIKRLERIHREVFDEERKMIELQKELTLLKVSNEMRISELFMTGKIDGTNDQMRKAQVIHHTQEMHGDIAIYENLYAEQRAIYNAKKREADDLQYIVRLIETTSRQ
ncbi:hypothetical protein [Bacillus sp. AFS053548]|uniref:hypothetical protein n=1 Tax=Bacillus sp. AFS053548 TaxID=2033505 RepID=UPI000BFD3907|nr:hypothetical protein [Bacillus sp. AFS053548]PGM58299.1 hypothetical protein CN946_06035 [Bacillus sp. AFS053548]